MAASLTSSRSVDEIHNLLLCGACKKTINEPKILSCSHSFCKTCVENLATQDKENVDGEGKKLNCPTCRSTTTLKPDENVAGLPNHEFILKLLTAVGPNRNQHVSICSYCQKEPAITICMECELLLCQFCCGSHDTWPRNRSHILVSISEIINRDEQQRIGAEALSCTQHKDTIPKFYCETCKELICIKCVASVHTKPGHACVAIHEIYRKQQDALKPKCATIKAMLQEGNKVGRPASFILV
jgi:tripartite motif-containing protein 2/3/tripartite motif-containing protein 56